MSCCTLSQQKLSVKLKDEILQSRKPPKGESLSGPSSPMSTTAWTMGYPTDDSQLLKALNLQRSISPVICRRKAIRGKSQGNPAEESQKHSTYNVPLTQENKQWDRFLDRQAQKHLPLQRQGKPCSDRNPKDDVGKSDDQNFVSDRAVRQSDNHKKLDKRVTKEVLEPRGGKGNLYLQNWMNFVGAGFPQLSSPSPSSPESLDDQLSQLDGILSPRSSTRSKNADSLLSIFPRPEDPAFGLDVLMKAANISAEDLQMDQEKWWNAASNWEMILQKMLPKAEAEEVIDSLCEVFGIDENSFKAFNAFTRLKTMENLQDKRSDLINLLEDAVQINNNACLIEITDKGSDILFDEGEIKVLQENSIFILERLLPLRAVELTAAIEVLFKEDPTRRMAAVYHVLERYIDYGLTSMQALTTLLSNETLIHSSEDILRGSEQYELVHPTVSFEVKFDTQKEKCTESDKKQSLQVILDNFLKDENAILWMSQEYERTRHIHKWEPFKVTKDDFEEVKLFVENAWFGGGPHEKVTVEFKYSGFNNNSEIPPSEKKRLHQLNNFFQLLLENVYQLVPIQEEFVKKGDTWESNRRLDSGDPMTTYEYRVTQLYQGLRVNSTMLEETASVFKSLGDKGASYSEAQNILQLLDSPQNPDKLTIRVQRVKHRVPVNVIACGPIFVQPEQKKRLKELPEDLINKFHQLLTRELLSGNLDVEEREDILEIMINPPVLFNLRESVVLARETILFKEKPRNTISAILNKYRDNNGTIGGLIGAFSFIKEEYEQNKKYVAAMTSLIAGMERIIAEVRRLADEQAKKQFANDRSLKTLVKFLKDHEPDGMRKYAKARGYRCEQFLEIARDQHVVPGDMICFYRKNWTISYVHAGIYTPVRDKKFIVHVQQEEGGMLKRVSLDAKVKWEELEDVLEKNDRVFYIRNCENSLDQAEVLSKVEACIFEEPIKFTYNGFFSSCQTFCCKVLGSHLFEELNPEAFLTQIKGKKAFAGWMVSGAGTSLTELMEDRFLSRSRINLPQTDGGRLIKICPDDCKLSCQSKNA